MKEQRKQDMPAAKVEVWPLEKIIPYDKNPREHPPSQVAALAKLMQAHGIDQPIVVDEGGVILKGHGRKLAAEFAGFAEFPVVVRRGMSEADKVAMRIQDNQVSLLAGWDSELLRLEVGSLQAGGFDLPMLGFDGEWLAKVMNGPAPPGEFGVLDESMEIDHQCPKCGYRWSGATVTRKREAE